MNAPTVWLTLAGEDAGTLTRALSCHVIYVYLRLNINNPHSFFLISEARNVHLLAGEN